MFNNALTIRIPFFIYGHVNTVHLRVSTEIGGYRSSGCWNYWRSIVHIGVSTEIWGYRYSGYWKYLRSIRPSKLNTVLYIRPSYYGSYWSFNGNLRVQIQSILKILSINRALWIKMLFCIYGHVTTFYIGNSAEIWWYRFSGYWEYWRSIRPSQLEYCFVYMSTRVDIENIDFE
jgi:hypothetical protein